MHSLKRVILSGTTALSASSVIVRLMSFLSVLLITRSMSLFDYGTMTLALTVAGPFSFLSGLGLDVAVSADMARALGENKIGAAKRLYQSFVKQKIIITIILVIASLIFAEPLAIKFGQIFADYFFWIVIFVGVNVFASIFGILLQTYAKFTVISLVNGAESFLRLLILFLLFSFFSITPISAIGASIAAKILSILFAAPPVGKILHSWRAIVPCGAGMLKLMRTHGKWGALSQGIIPQIDNTIRPWMTNFFFGTAAVALTAVPSSIFSALSILFPIQKVIAPLIAKNIGDRAIVQRIAVRTIKLNIWVSTLFVVVSAILIAPFTRLFFPQYEKSIFLFWVLIPRLVLLAIGSGHDPLFNALHIQKQLVKYQLVGIISDFILLPLSFLTFGLPGIYVERFIAITAAIWLRENFMRRKYAITTILPRTYFRFTSEDRAFAREVWAAVRRNFKLSLT